MRMTSWAILFLRNGAKAVPWLETGLLSHEVSFVFICAQLNTECLYLHQPSYSFLFESQLSTQVSKNNQSSADRLRGLRESTWIF